MRTKLLITFIICVAITPTLLSQPDLSKITDNKQKIAAWIGYCESLRLNSSGKSNFPALEQAAMEGVNMTPSDDDIDKARFYFYIAFGCYYQVKFDSAQYYYYQSLHESQKANSAESIAAACVALISINFQLRQQDKVDSCKTILQAIVDTTQNKKVLEDAYSGLASYYQQKSYYSTSQNFLIKSIEMRKKEVDTTTQTKLRADYAILCYMLYKVYSNTDVPEKGLQILKEGWPFANASPPVYIRYFSSFTEAYTLLGNIDSALSYEKQLEQLTENSPVVPSEAVSSKLSVAKYYIDHNQVDRAFQYVTLADTLASKSKSPILIYQAQLWNGRYLEKSGKFEQAISQLSLSLPVAKQISKEQYVEGLKYMAEAQKGAGSQNEAIQYYEQYIQQSDSLVKEEISHNLADQETRYETNRKEQRIVSLSKENQLRDLQLRTASRTRLVLILGLVALGVIALLLYFIYRNKERLNQVLNERNTRLDTLNSELAVANDTKAKLFGIIGHDLRSPISQIIQLLQLQKERPGLLTAEAKSKHAEKLKTASEYLLETMEDLLLWSKSQMQHFTPQFTPVRIKGVVEKEMNMLQSMAEEKGVRVLQNVQDSFIQNTDENFLSVIVRNLLQNAIRNSDGSTTVDVSLNEGGIAITNETSKVTAKELNDLLNSRQVDSGRLGLGLQIVNDLAQSIKANVSFKQKSPGQVSALLTWNS